MDDVFLKYQQTELSENQQFKNFLVKWKIIVHNPRLEHHQNLSFQVQKRDSNKINKCLFGKRVIENLGDILAFSFLFKQKGKTFGS